MQCKYRRNLLFTACKLNFYSMKFVFGSFRIRSRIRTNYLDPDPDLAKSFESWLSITDPQHWLQPNKSNLHMDTLLKVPVLSFGCTSKPLLLSSSPPPPYTHSHNIDNSRIGIMKIHQHTNTWRKRLTTTFPHTRRLSPPDQCRIQMDPELFERSGSALRISDPDLKKIRN
jgi:hypothetical protein